MPGSPVGVPSDIVKSVLKLKTVHFVKVAQQHKWGTMLSKFPTLGCNTLVLSKVTMLDRNHINLR